MYYRFLYSHLLVYKTTEDYLRGSYMIDITVGGTIFIYENGINCKATGILQYQDYFKDKYAPAEEEYTLFELETNINIRKLWDLRIKDWKGEKNVLTGKF